MGDLKTGLQTAFVRFALERLATFGSFAWREISLIRGVEGNLRKLHRTFSRIQLLVDNIDGSLLRFSGGDRGKAWQMLFEDLRKLAYEADALLDRVFLHLSRYCSVNSINAEEQSQVMPMVISSLEDLDLPHKISEMQNKLDELTKELESIRMVEKMNEDSCDIAQLKNFYSTSFMNDEPVVGKENDIKCILELLSNECEESNFSVIPLVGMAGIGKTTLARLAYNDENARNNFEKRIWVSVSMEFDLVRVTKAIIESVTLSACNLSDLNSLQLALQDILHGKRFLLVLDDYWCDSVDDWNSLRLPFGSCSKGSKIIVTTRSAKVSLVVGSFEAYKLEILSEDDCWNLFKQRTSIDLEANPKLESIGKSIAKKCKGLPLVAVTLGSLVHRKTCEDEWQSVLETDLWDMPENLNIFPILMRSYIALPVRLKKCFSYCSIFPQEYEFEVDELVLLWMAEGFIEPVEGRRLEDVGRAYFDDLYLRSFFQPCGNASDDIKYKMHGFTHDMARLVSKDICSHLKYSMSSFYGSFGTSCHLSLLLDDTEEMKLETTGKNERLRTFLLMHADEFGRAEVDNDLFSDMQFLRVLGLHDLQLNEVPDSIEELEYLRYLDLSGNPIQDLPHGICKILALQTLKLNHCHLLHYLPEDIWKLSNLRHLYLGVMMDCYLQCMPMGIGMLTSLQTLSVYVVGNENEAASIGELKNLNCLRGSLCIKYIDSVSNENDAVEAMLHMKRFLEKLELYWRPLYYATDVSLMKEKQVGVLSKLQPHKDLKELVIINYCGTMYPSWLDQPCRKFTRIELHGLKELDHLPSLGQLPSLKYFAISGMPLVENIEETFYGTGDDAKFPSLEFFKLEKMSMLIQWKDVMSDGAMPHLNAFEIEDCPNLICLPPNLQSLIPKSSIKRCPRLKETTKQAMDFGGLFC